VISSQVYQTGQLTQNKWVNSYSGAKPLTFLELYPGRNQGGAGRAKPPLQNFWPPWQNVLSIVENY